MLSLLERARVVRGCSYTGERTEYCQPYLMILIMSLKCMHIAGDAITMSHTVRGIQEVQAPRHPGRCPISQPAEHSNHYRSPAQAPPPAKT